MAEQAQDILEEILQESERERRLFGFDAATNAALRGVADMEEAALGAHATKNSEALRKFDRKNEYDILRGPFAIDTDKILHNALYNRYIDKTQVFSFYKNDDITRRSTHVQLVSRIARTIGRALRLNLDLIEAIAVGHDIGHTPFGHRGEQYLSDLYLQSDRHRYFNHNVHSVRVLKTITKTNLTLQTLDGILCHNGEDEFIEYRPSGLNSFEAFEQNVEQCYTDKAFIKTLRPNTMEGCVVRISDRIAYIWKDRQDARKLDLTKDVFFTPTILGANNIEFLNNIVINLVKNSMDADCLRMDPEVFDALRTLKGENYEFIYKNEQVMEPYETVVRPMMERMYRRLYEDLILNQFQSPVYQHHLSHYILGKSYRDEENRVTADPDDIVVDYIASMTDDYFIDLYEYLFPDDPFNQKVRYIPYF